MVVSKVQTLVDFQGVTGIKDFEICTSILFQHNWNLEKAINSIMSPECVPPADAGSSSGQPINDEQAQVGAEQASQLVTSEVGIQTSQQDLNEVAPPLSSDSSAVNLRSRMITFKVQFQHKNITLVLPASESLGRLKELLEQELGVPKELQELLGLFTLTGADQTLLSDLYLQTETRLVLRVLRRNDLNGRGIVSGHERLGVIAGDTDSTENVAGNEDNTNPRQNVVPPDSGEHAMEQEGSYYSSSESDDEDYIRRSARQNIAPSRESASNFEPMIPEDVTDDRLCIEHFTSEFASRYSQVHPEFFVGRLEEATRQSLVTRAADRRLLVLYLHYSDFFYTNTLCSTVLSNQDVVNTLNSHFLFWPWDLTHQNNSIRFMEAVTRVFGYGNRITNDIRRCVYTRAPHLIILSRGKRGNSVIDSIDGNVTAVEMNNQLMQVVNEFQIEKQQDMAEERLRQEWERIRLEQDAAYQESLEADRRKAEEIRMEEERRIQEKEELEAQKQEKEKRKEALIAAAASLVPDEPTASYQGHAYCLRIRLLTGQVLTRRFYPYNTLNDLLNFIIASGYLMEDFKVLTTFPHRDISALDQSLRLDEVFQCLQEVLTLAER